MLSKKNQKEKRRTRANTEGKVQCSFLCSPQSRMWAEMQPRGHEINQVARGNSTSCLETDPLIYPRTSPPSHKAAHLSCLLVCFFFVFFSNSWRSLRLSSPNWCLQTSSLLLRLLPQPRYQSGMDSLIYGGRSSTATMRHLLASTVRT